MSKCNRKGAAQTTPATGHNNSLIRE
jgi:hypothetical protein